MYRNVAKEVRWVHYMPHRHIINKANVSNEPECQGHIFSMTEYLAGLYLDSAIYSIGVVCLVCQTGKWLLTDLGTT